MFLCYYKFSNLILYYLDVSLFRILSNFALVKRLILSIKYFSIFILYKSELGNLLLYLYIISIGFLI